MNFTKQSLNHQNQSFADQSKQKSSVRVNSQERCLLLYEKGKIKNEYMRLAHNNPNKLKEEKELKECTFKPKIYSGLNRRNSAGNLEGSFYDRTLNWKKMNQEK
jgi:hypothetical protein